MGLEALNQSRPTSLVQRLFGGLTKKKLAAPAEEYDPDAAINTNIADLLAGTVALPATIVQLLHLANSSIKQSESLKNPDYQNKGVIGTYNSIVKFLFSKLSHRFNLKDDFEQSSDPRLTEHNKEVHDSLQGVFNPYFATSSAELIFNLKNVFANLRITNEKDSNTFVDYLHKLTRFPLLISSLAGSLLTIPGGLAETGFALFGKEKLRQASEVLSRAGNTFTPYITNHRSLVELLGALRNSLATGHSFRETMRERGLNIGNIIQALGGGLTLPFAFKSVFTRLSKAINDNSEFIIPAARRVSGFIETKANDFKFNGFEGVEDKVEHLLISSTDLLTRRIFPLIENISNQALLRPLLKYFLPYDTENKRIVLQPKEWERLGNKSLGLAGGLAPRMFGFIQSALAQLTSVFTSATDAHAQTNARLPVRVIDRLLGAPFKLLAFPSYFMYLGSNIIPQMLVSYYSFKQEQALANGDVRYNPMEELAKLCYKLRQASIWSSIPGSRLLANIIEQRIIRQDAELFNKQDRLDEYMGKMAEEQHKQELALKGVASITEARNLMRLITSKVPGARASVDEDNLSGVMHTRHKLSQWAGAVKNHLRAIPVIGPPASWILGLIAKPLEVKVNKKKKAANTAEPLAANS